MFGTPFCGPSLRGAALALVAAAVAVQTTLAFLPPQNPPWGPDWSLNGSTISMAANRSGWFDVSLAAQFGVVSFDWSNAKAQWANAHPMDCEERMLTQARRTKAAHPAGHVFTYANLVKALPWLTTVRRKLLDPACSGFFLRFAPGGGFPNGSYHVPPCTAGKCSALYHDQEQTPEHPKGDGDCEEECDCGPGLPCGEYLWDHRNGSMLRDFLVNEYIGGPAYLGSPAISGLFIDDFWCSALVNGSKACADPVQGPSEINRYSQLDMGLSDADIAAITQGWLETMTAVQARVLELGGFTWSLMLGQSNANAAPVMLPSDPKGCAALLQGACQPGSSEQIQLQSAPLLFGLKASHGNASVPLPQLEQDVAAFLLLRGPSAFIGWGQRGLTWPVGVSWANQTNKTVLLPPLLRSNFGAPLSNCSQVKPGVFRRAYESVVATLDCNSFSAQLTGAP